MERITHLAVEASGAIHLFTTDADLIRVINTYVEAHPANVNQAVEAPPTIEDRVRELASEVTNQAGYHYKYILATSIRGAQRKEIKAYLLSHNWNYTTTRIDGHQQRVYRLEL